MSRLVVVSNRVAVPRGARNTSGGLAVAVNAALKAQGGIWFGWSGHTGGTQRAEFPKHQERDGVTYVTLPLTTRDYDDYYKGFSNRVLWPLMHYRLELLHYRRQFFEGYRRVNAWLATHLIELLDAGDRLWIHDFHLLPIAAEVRARGFEGPIGFFLHTPFPPLEVLRALPPYRQLLHWLGAYDLVGFHTDTDRHSFHDAMREALEARIEGPSQLSLGVRRISTGVFPIGIDASEVSSQAQRGRNSRQLAVLRSSLEGRRLIIGADRLDYSKGLIERFRSYQHLLAMHPEMHGNIVYLQVAEPSRSEVPEYQEVRHELDAVAGEIIGSYARFDWMPVRYISRRMRRPTLLAFLSFANVGLVTSLRDGMNLVAKEYVASQDPEDPGVLILSELAGAAEQLTDALLVNPFDIEGVGEALAEALSMPLAERKRRWEGLMNTVKGYDIETWRTRFLRALEDAFELQIRRSDGAIDR